MRLKEYFFDKPNSNPNPFKPTSDFTPDANRDKALDMYIKAVQRDVLDAYNNSSNRKTKPNLTAAEQRSLSDLQNCGDIIIKRANKGGAIVVMNKEDYLNEGFRPLGCNTFYEPLDSDPTNKIAAEITKTLKSLKAREIIDSCLYEFLAPHNPKPGRFYMLPKIHKPGNPRRLIVSSIGTATEKISSFVDHLLKDIPPRLPSYIKDTNHFLEILSKCEPPNASLLVTQDVTSLYTNIPHEDGVLAAEAAYLKYSDRAVDPSVLPALLNLILKNNNFEFDGRQYLQINGTAMGAKMAPTYANIFMGALQDKFRAVRDKKPSLYKRFLDDIFMVWPHSEEDLRGFISDFGLVHPAIKFTHSFSATTVNFLDVKVTLTEKNH
ncbi:uncharacterized protein LOC135398377 [Ornithodoros turicata]|uniref:uncharacterized protein LOC135376173 n=1 Tax=Ornithodoros turicata TaxID=34597 RepID=UPI003138F792